MDDNICNFLAETDGLDFADSDTGGNFYLNLRQAIEFKSKLLWWII
jgi:hypothetical protein